jgi:hypothetical protein
MSFESGLYTLLTSDATIGPIVGTRVYPILMGEGSALPAIVYTLTSGDCLSTLDGPAGLFQGHLEISCHAGGPAAQGFIDACALAKAVKELLDCYQGTLTDGTVVQGMFCIDVRDGFDDALRTHHRDVDFSFWLTE